ncbi:glycosyltransferase family 4 protein [Mongoliibacter ruber]|uniref:Glycosyltransferase involved in cell wall biosynthesis n=1 Tax=Mongoliibacter ruber TaxID=1750599 RepID=A0A2T0WG40_9BACT|nr:glycosyltransferase family 4 protein [Mongoliibacter ruber]PRY85680.1 glycosyltransferase involved in cell wall biosynthesis [Mongoliibacter ruber]
MKVRVLFCQETIASGGVEQRRLSLARFLDNEKYEVKIICTYKKGPLPSEFEKAGVEVIAVGGMKHPFHWAIHKKVLGIIKQFKPHIIHGAVFEGNAMASIGGFIGKVPIVLVEETSHPIYRSKKAILLQRFLFTAADRIIGISQSVTEFLKEVVKIPSKKIKLINNGVGIPEIDLDFDKQSFRSSIGIGTNDFVVGFVGRLFDDVKLVTILVKAIAELKDEKVKLVIVGDGKDFDLIQKTIIELKLTKQVFMVGYQQIPSPYYQIMDVFAIPSAHEGFGLSAVEAMMHRLPVIASNVGGLKNIVVEGTTGYLVPSNSVEALTEKIQSLIQFAERRIKMGNDGYERAMEFYTSKKYCEAVENLYLDLLIEKGISK